jgi:hypothetical protein
MSLPPQSLQRAEITVEARPSTVKRIALRANFLGNR